ncbi:Hypothetical protein A7982_07927 [Minicystis rosea]|nr:Hypothetical protein A7982_07927 [Minicystis rosea]
MVSPFQWPSKGWTAVTTTDFNRDGLNDMIWTNAERVTGAVWLLNGTQLLAPGLALDARQRVRHQR